MLLSLFSWFLSQRHSEELSGSIIRMTIGEAGTTLAVCRKRHYVTILRSSETSVLIRASLRNIPEDGILQIRGYIKSEINSRNCLVTSLENTAVPYPTNPQHKQTYIQTEGWAYTNHTHTFVSRTRKHGYISTGMQPTQQQITYSKSGNRSYF
jgi:hypothetical protein